MKYGYMMEYIYIYIYVCIYIYICMYIYILVNAWVQVLYIYLKNFVGGSKQKSVLYLPYSTSNTSGVLL